ncbi:hypothetical protein FHG66_19960 [Rubellimicrobium rubrum]|uniref:RNA polymerase sigma-70 region 2 domain-containing protein n=1 Tax=Rubellimicrobium rubrum TaxID=2585369 RepID=A0A5C4MLI9_9RHOB|nr:sigma factor [Rubellimicrobium rubrum]TNC45383.1 hypothetical protein FHG66_19960 [Rubellimicrobium rubrum]
MAARSGCCLPPCPRRDRRPAAIATDRFAADQPRLLALAVQVLGSVAEAEDVVQDAWLRETRAGPDGIQDLCGWLSTVVARAAPTDSGTAGAPPRNPSRMRPGSPWMCPIRRPAPRRK